MQKPDTQADTPQNGCGIVHAVRGAVVDVVFADQVLPPINTALDVVWDQPTQLTLEVHSHLDENGMSIEGN
ncbi:MAG: hypothetical protein NWQ23_09280 [Yoonia sp.]|uniref:hypothetical protein n=1 Tax=Yoonia sp. TaxID=2212373 RepID=UPI00273DEEAB|nr:hypothetical protein [Yoonia sp.]MDP5085599.1 hypothetical protein [Yoonia sp.]